MNQASSTLYNYTEKQKTANITVTQFQHTKNKVSSNKQKFVNYLISQTKEWFEQAYPTVEYIQDIEINGRLTRANGLYRWRRKANQSHFHVQRIDISSNLIVEALLLDDFSKVIDTMKHELTHYALHMQGLPYDDGHPTFENALRKHDISSTMSSRTLQPKHIFECTECKGQVIERRKFDVNRYRCGKCKARFEYKGRKVMR